MHSYIFDYFLTQKKYEGVVAKIETRLTDLGLQGKNCHVGPLKSLKSIVRDELRSNPKTIVAIGNNVTFNGIINALDGANITIGIVPVGANNSLATIFGINDEDSACTALSARLIENISIGAANGFYFVSQASIQNTGSIIDINGRYTVEPTGPGAITIINPSVNPRPGRTINSGSLGVYIQVQKKRFLKNESDTTFICANSVIVNNSRGQAFKLDGVMDVMPPVTFGVKKNALSVIVGRDRKF